MSNCPMLSFAMSHPPAPGGPPATVWGIMGLRWVPPREICQKVSRLPNIYIDTDVLPFEGRRKNTFLDVAREATATACVLKMERRGAAFVPRHGDWGLLDAATGLVVNPAGLVSDEHIEMSDWELHDFAIQ